jgi:inner membrane protein
MQGKTHAVVGASCALLLTSTKSVDVLALGTTVAVIGSLLPDVDVKTSKIGKVTTKLLFGLVVLIGAMIALKKMGYSNLVPNVEMPTNLTNGMSGAACLIAILIFGYYSPHRGATHSLLICVIASFATWLLIPQAGIYMLIGYLSHLVLDLLNYQGIKLFYPLPNEVSFDICKSDGIINSVLFVIGAFLFIALVTIKLTQCNPITLSF